MFRLQSSNPALKNESAFNPYAYAEGAPAAARQNVTTVQGVVNKTAILVAICVAGGAVGYSLLLKFPNIVWISAIASFMLVLGFGFLLYRKPKAAVVFGPIYAVIEGVFLGSVTALADHILKAQGLEAALGGVGVQAFIITMAVVVTMLGLYKIGWVKPTARFRAVVFTLTGAIMLAYLVSFVLGLVWNHPLPLISFASAVQDTGAMGLLGLGINLFILLIAALFLVIDFGEVERHVTAASPKHMEWYLAYALLITLAWIYFEAVKLTLRMAVLFNRD